MPIGFLRRIFSEAGETGALIWRDSSHTYGWLLRSLDAWKAWLTAEGVPPGAVVVLPADFSPESVAGLLALVEHGCIVVPLAETVGQNAAEFTQIAQAEFAIEFSQRQSESVKSVTRLGRQADHPHYETLRNRRHPGLVLFSSGSTGRSKAVVHDMVKLLAKYQVRRQNLRTMAFLLLDHIGGIDTLLYALSNASSLVLVQDRTPDSICECIEKYRVEVLPVAPTFLNMLAFSEAYRRHDLSSLKYVTYGAEVMSPATLAMCHQMFPGATLLQKYGTSEVGTLRSRSESSESLWMKIGGEGYQIRVRDGVLQIKAESAMLGYLNAPSPFTDDGWFITGDLVEVKGEYLRVLGRQSDVINVGGNKVLPAEIESVIELMDNVVDVAVYGEANPITGQIVCARLSLAAEESLKELSVRVKKFCAARLPAHKIPVKIEIASGFQSNKRLKQVRRASDTEVPRP